MTTRMGSVTASVPPRTSCRHRDGTPLVAPSSLHGSTSSTSVPTPGCGVDDHRAADALDAPVDAVGDAATIVGDGVRGRTRCRCRARTPRCGRRRSRRTRRRGPRRRVWRRWWRPRGGGHQRPGARRRGTGRRPRPPRRARCAVSSTSAIVASIAARRPAVWRGVAAPVEPTAQLTFLATGQTDDGGIVGTALDERQRLQHRVVQVRGHLFAFGGADAGPTFVGEVAHERRDPRRQHQTEPGDDDAHHQEGVACGGQIEVQRDRRARPRRAAPMRRLPRAAETPRRLGPGAPRPARGR